MTGTQMASDEQCWMCAACGRTSRTRYGFDTDNQSVAEHGWDESCAMNAVLVYSNSIKRNDYGIVTEAKAVERGVVARERT